jgi:hypothetical protein
MRHEITEYDALTLLCENPSYRLKMKMGVMEVFLINEKAVEICEIRRKNFKKWKQSGWVIESGKNGRVRYHKAAFWTVPREEYDQVIKAVVNVTPEKLPKRPWYEEDRVPEWLIRKTPKSDFYDLNSFD